MLLPSPNLLSVDRNCTRMRDEGTPLLVITRPLSEQRGIGSHRGSLWRAAAPLDRRADRRRKLRVKCIRLGAKPRLESPTVFRWHRLKIFWHTGESMTVGEWRENSARTKSQWKQPKSCMSVKGLPAKFHEPTSNQPRRTGKRALPSIF